MKRKIIFTVLMSLVLLWGCTIQGPDYTEELDLVYSNYDAQFNFVSKGTYSIPDSIVKITGDPTAPPEYIKKKYAAPIIANIRQNMGNLGWTEVDITASPDVQLLPAAWSTTTIIYGGYWGGYWCWYYPYYCGGGWYYPYYPVSSYTTGTLLLTMTSPKDEATDGSVRVVWTAAMNGLLQGVYDVDRVNGGVNQAFKQSPYLKTN